MLHTEGKRPAVDSRHPDILNTMVQLNPEHCGSAAPVCGAPFTALLDLPQELLAFLVCPMNGQTH